MSEPGDRCCVCGGHEILRFCGWCGHTFCANCRWGPEGLFWRGKAAVMEWLTGNKPKHCKH